MMEIFKKVFLALIILSVPIGLSETIIFNNDGYIWMVMVEAFCFVMGVIYGALWVSSED